MLVDAFYHGFQTGLDVKFKPITLTDAQWDEINQLAKNKYTAEMMD